MDTSNSEIKGTRRGLGFKLTIIISSILFVVFSGIAAYDAVFDYSNTIEENYTDMTMQNQLMAENISEYFSNAYQTYRDWDGVVQEELKKPVSERSREYLKAHIQIFLERNPILASMGLIFEANAFDAKDALFANNGFYGPDGRFTLYTQKNNSGITIRMMDELYDNHEDAWYTEPMKHKKLVVIPPFTLDKKNPCNTCCPHLL